jgi:hypothetical protein
VDVLRDRFSLDRAFLVQHEGLHHETGLVVHRAAAQTRRPMQSGHHPIPQRIDRFPVVVSDQQQTVKAWCISGRPSDKTPVVTSRPVNLNTLERQPSPS